ncbi:MAG: methionine--tRNA ligase [Clostridia bacterium]
MEKEKYYITTPIYYPSGKWHIGTCYTTIICDALARFKRMQGADVFYLTGTDEHGQKIQKVAAEAGVPVKEYIDKVVFELQDLWKLLDISYDKFIRTTDDYHQKAVQKIFTKLFEQGDIYKSSYEGWYCTPCESFWTKTQLKDGKCPDCGRDVELTKEESYFFKMSKYQDKLIKLIEDNPDFLQPPSRQNEMLNNFLRPGLQDLCVSRTSFDWGVQVPFDPKHVVYVWLDALTNYITALGYGSDDTTLFDKFWPADVHMMGKEIVRFHSIIWPAILMALDLPLPKKIYGHGWLLFGSDKMSKSKGNVVDPFILSERYGVDALRYYLLREVAFGQDGSYTNESFIKRYNSDLANDLGNLVSRVCAMVAQYFGGVIPESRDPQPLDQELVTMCEELYPKLCKNIDDLFAPNALENIWKLIQRANKYIDECAPWTLAKDTANNDRLASVMYNLCETIRVVAVCLQPFLTKCPSQIFEKLGVTNDNLKSFDSITKFGNLPTDTKISKGEPLFARCDFGKEMAYLDGIVEKQMEEARKIKESANNSNCNKDKKMNENAQKTDTATTEVENAVNIAQIGIEEFEKIQLKVGKIIACEKVEKADKLLCSKIDLGEDAPRTIVSGIAKWYSPEQMIGKSVVVVTNLKPVKLRGIESQGMVLCASDENNNLTLISPLGDIKAGSEVR